MRCLGTAEKSLPLCAMGRSSARCLPFCEHELDAGRQVYVIYPLIDESEKLDAKAAAAEYELWRERLRPFRCDLLHGRIPAPEKQEIMERFRRGETKALISTTVLEVGVDVPNATVMLIENAERFGLAQLHQLRGTNRPRRAQVVLHFAYLGTGERGFSKARCFRKNK